MPRKTVFVLTLLLGLAVYEAALACSCVEPPPPKQARDEAYAVFSAKVVRAPSDNDYSMRVQVKAVWKGMDCKTFEMGAGFATCIGWFQKGKTYLIYADRGENGILYTHLCTRTRAITEAAEDLAAFGKPVKSCG